VSVLAGESQEELVGAIRAAVFDPNGQNVIVGIPQEMIERAQDGSKGVLSVRDGDRGIGISGSL
jgi:hypothetical protein